MHDSVSGDLESKLVVLLLGGQNAIDEEIGSFEVIRFDSQLLNGVPSGLIASVHVDLRACFGVTQPVAENWNWSYQTAMNTE